MPGGVCNVFTSGNNFILKAWVDYNVFIFSVIFLPHNYRFKYTSTIITHWNSCEEAFSQWLWFLFLSNNLRSSLAHLGL